MTPIIFDEGVNKSLSGPVVIRVFRKVINKISDLHPGLTDGQHKDDCKRALELWGVAYIATLASPGPGSSHSRIDVLALAQSP